VAKQKAKKLDVSGVVVPFSGGEPPVPCTVPGCIGHLSGHSRFCRACLTTLQKAPRQLVERGWWADAKEMESIFGAMTTWLEGQR